MCIGTRPDSPSTSRTMSTVAPRSGMQSVMRTSPSSVRNVVSSTRVSSTYLRSTEWIPPAGARSHRPWSGLPSSAEKTAPESNRGAHHQSMDPSRPTSAAVCVSPIRA